MTIYAVFICTIIVTGQPPQCLPTAFKNLPTAEACEERRRFMAGIDSRITKVVCLKKTIPAWEPVR